MKYTKEEVIELNRESDCYRKSMADELEVPQSQQSKKMNL